MTRLINTISAEVV